MNCKSQTKRILFCGLVVLALGVPVTSQQCFAKQLAQKGNPVSADNDTRSSVAKNPISPTGTSNDKELQTGVAADQAPLRRPITLRAACDISGSVTNTPGGKETYSVVSTAIRGTLAPSDRFSLMLFNDNNAFTPVPEEQWRGDADQALKSLLHLRLRGGDRTFLSPALGDLKNRSKATDIILIVTDGVIDTGSKEGDKRERREVERAAALLVDQGLIILIVPVRSAKIGVPITWLAGVLRAKVIPVEELRSRGLHPYITSSRQPETSPHVEEHRREIPELSWRFYLLGLLLAGVGTFVILKFRGHVLKPISQTMRPELTEEPVVEEPERFGFNISWAEGLAEFREIEIAPESGEITIGSSPFDTICTKDLLPAHVRIRLDANEIILECHGSVRLTGGIELGPFGASPAEERFPADEEIPFSAGNTAFIIRQVLIGKSNDALTRLPAPIDGCYKEKYNED